jgi:hypothetical protein
MQYEEIDPWEVVKNAIENNVPNPVAQSMTLMIIDLAHWLSHTFHK